MKKLKILLLSLCILFILFFTILFLNYKTPILMYHSLNTFSKADYPTVSPSVFFKQMEFIKKGGYKVISLSDYCKNINKKRNFFSKELVITFDDGVKDNLIAADILKKFGFPATIFLIVNKIDAEGYLTKEDIAWILKNTKVTIGSHTLNHSYLPNLDETTLENEIKNSKTKLQSLFNIQIDTIAYPVGGFNKKVLEKVEEADYICACTTNRGFSRKINRFALRRIKITNADLGFKLWVKLSGFYDFFRKVKKPF